MTREVVLDTETTGLDSALCRLVEFGAIELQGSYETGRILHLYANPQCDMPEEARKIHGLTTEFLSEKPIFAEIAQEIAAFLDGATIVAHNAPFDVGFLTAEFRRVGIQPMWGKVVDTAALARRKFPRSPANLNALLDRYQIDRSNRDLHGALLDAKLLVPVYFKLLGLDELRLVSETSSVAAAAPAAVIHSQNWFRPRQIVPPTPEEVTAHNMFVTKLGSDAVWNRWAKVD